MPSEQEVMAARMAIVELWQETAVPVGSFIDSETFARAALEAAERVRALGQQADSADKR